MILYIDHVNKAYMLLCRSLIGFCLLCLGYVAFAFWSEGLKNTGSTHKTSSLPNLYMLYLHLFHDFFFVEHHLLLFIFMIIIINKVKMI